MDILDNSLNAFYDWAEKSVVDEALLFAVLIAMVETFAQTSMKTGAENNLYFVRGLLLYTMVGYILHFAYTKFPLSKMNITWSSISIVLATAIGYFLYQEPLNMWKFAAVVFALTAIYCISNAE